MQLLHSLTSPEKAPGQVIPRLLLSQGALDMLDAYVNTPAKTEINGFAYVKQLTDRSTFFVGSASDVFITRQTVSVGGADVDGGDYALALDQAVQDGRVAELKLQWHSHPRDAYFSATDLGNIENFGAAGAEWFISLVTNREGDIHARLDMFRPVRFGAEMEVRLYRTADQELVDRAKTEVEALVTTVSTGRGRRRRAGNVTVTVVK